MKTTEIANFITQEILKLCQCPYSSSYIVGGQLFCTSKDEVIYQARLLSMTEDKTALELRNYTQRWVLSKPVIMIKGKSYQLDSSCTVVVNELGTTSCDIPRISTEPLSEKVTLPTYVLGTAIGLGMVLLLIIIVITILLVLYFVRNKKRKSRLDIRLIIAN